MNSFALKIQVNNDTFYINIVDDLHYILIIQELQRYKIDKDYCILRDNNKKCHYLHGGNEKIYIERLEYVYE